MGIMRGQTIALAISTIMAFKLEDTAVKDEIANAPKIATLDVTEEAEFADKAKGATLKFKPGSERVLVFLDESNLVLNKVKDGQADEYEALTTVKFEVTEMKRNGAELEASLKNFSDVKKNLEALLAAATAAAAVTTSDKMDTLVKNLGSSDFGTLYDLAKVSNGTLEKKNKDFTDTTSNQTADVLKSMIQTMFEELMVCTEITAKVKTNEDADKAKAYDGKAYLQVAFATVDDKAKVNDGSAKTEEKVQAGYEMSLSKGTLSKTGGSSKPFYKTTVGMFVIGGSILAVVALAVVLGYIILGKKNDSKE